MGGGQEMEGGSSGGAQSRPKGPRGTEPFPGRPRAFSGSLCCVLDSQARSDPASGALGHVWVRLWCSWHWVDLLLSPRLPGCPHNGELSGSSVSSAQRRALVWNIPGVRGVCHLRSMMGQARHNTISSPSTP